MAMMKDTYLRDGVVVLYMYCVHECLIWGVDERVVVHLAVPSPQFANTGYLSEQASFSLLAIAFHALPVLQCFSSVSIPNIHALICLPSSLLPSFYTFYPYEFLLYFPTQALISSLPSSMSSDWFL